MLILHKLAIRDIHVSLELASKASPVFLLTEWVNESALRCSPLSVEDPEAKKHVPYSGCRFYAAVSDYGEKGGFLP